MSVADGQAVNASVTNAAYLSRLTSSSTIGVISLNNASSGGLISNAQQQINENAADIVVLQANVLVNNFSAIIDPTFDDDNLDGYSTGSFWVNVTDNKAFIALDVSTGASIWKRLGSTMFKTVLTGQLDFSSSNVTDSAYVEFIADTGANIIRKIEFFYPDGDAMILAVGAAASEVDTALILAGGNELEVEIPVNSRISFKLATGGTSNTSGILSANLKAEA